MNISNKSRILLDEIFIRPFWCILAHQFYTIEWPKIRTSKNQWNRHIWINFGACWRNHFSWLAVSLVCLFVVFSLAVIFFGSENKLLTLNLLCNWIWWPSQHFLCHTKWILGKLYESCKCDRKRAKRQKKYSIQHYQPFKIYLHVTATLNGQLFFFIFQTIRMHIYSFRIYVVCIVFTSELSSPAVFH